MIRILLGLFVFMVSGCTTLSEPRPLNQDDPILQGVWISKPYGEVYEIADGGYTYYDWAPDTCVRWPDEEESLSDSGLLVQMRGNDRMALTIEQEPYPYRFERLAELPTHCNPPNADTPRSNFEAFASAFSAFYPFFDLYGVDWASRVELERQTISADTTDEELYETLKRLVDGIKDAHVEIIADINGEREIFDANAGKTETALFRTAIANGDNPMRARDAYRRKFWATDLRDELHAGESVITGDGMIQYGVISDDIGMISFITMGGYVETEDENELDVLNEALDAALSAFQGREVKAVIVNLALNYGGYDFISRAIAQRFAAEPTLVYSKLSANDPGAAPFVYTLQPSARIQFTGPVYLLTSDVTVSAGEIATLSLRALPNVTHVGEATRGAFSDVLARELPNGWSFKLSSELYYDHEGVLWEGKGVPPEIEIPVFDQTDPRNGFMDAMVRLIDLIDSETS